LIRETAAEKSPDAAVFFVCSLSDRTLFDPQALTISRFGTVSRDGKPCGRTECGRR